MDGLTANDEESLKYELDVVERADAEAVSKPARKRVERKAWPQSCLPHSGTLLLSGSSLPPPHFHHDSRPPTLSLAILVIVFTGGGTWQVWIPPKLILAPPPLHLPLSHPPSLLTCARGGSGCCGPKPSSSLPPRPFLHLLSHPPSLLTLHAQEGDLAAADPTHITVMRPRLVGASARRSAASVAALTEAMFIR